MLDATQVVAGTILSVKPVTNMDMEGKLFNSAKVRGRRTSVRALFERMKRNEDLAEIPYVFISHADCLKDAQLLRQWIQEEYPAAEGVVGDMGSVIGAHTRREGWRSFILEKRKRERTNRELLRIFFIIRH